MPPKIRIAKQDIINTSLSIIRESGVNALNARSLATYMGCSTQPIFSNYSSMDELKQDVIQTAYTIYQNYVNKEIQRRLIVMDFKILLNQTIGTRVLIPSLRKYNLQIDRLGVPH